MAQIHQSGTREVTAFGSLEAHTHCPKVSGVQVAPGWGAVPPGGLRLDAGGHVLDAVLGALLAHGCLLCRALRWDSAAVTPRR